MSVVNEYLEEESERIQDLSQSAVSKAWGRSVLGEFDYLVDFNSQANLGSRLKVIYAENGMGKTSFLRAVFLLLNPSEENLSDLADIPIATVGVEVRSGWTLQMERLLGEDDPEVIMELALTPPVGSEFEVSHIQVRSDVLDGRFARRHWAQSNKVSRFRALLSAVIPSTVFIGDNRSVRSSLEPPVPEGVSLREQREYAMRARDRMNPQRALDRLATEFTRMTIAGMSREGTAAAQQGTYLDITNRVLDGTSEPPVAKVARTDLLRRAEAVLSRGKKYEKYGLVSLRQVDGIREAIEATRANDTRLRQLHTVVDPYLRNIGEEIDRLTGAQRIIDTFVSSVNSFLNRKELRYSAMNGISLHSAKGVDLDVSNLSSGEQHLLLLLSQAALARFHNSLVIIDEPELSLGLRWQRNLLRELLSCTEGSDVLFLVASHSVQIIGDTDHLVNPVEVQ